MTPLGLTTIVDLAPRLVLPFSPQAALCLEATGLFVVAGLGVLHAVLRARRTAEPFAATAALPASPRPRTARVVPLRPSLDERVA